MTDRPTVSREGSAVVIRIPGDQVQGFRVALQECRCVDCKAARSNATQTILSRLVRALGSFKGDYR